MQQSLMMRLLRSFIRQPGYMGNLLLRKIRFSRRYRWILSHRGMDDRVPLPLVYKLVLTYKCNLHCANCFQWGESGWCGREPPEDMREELDWSVIENLLGEAGPSHPSFILTGGEPLLYSRFEELAHALKRHKCFTTVCTNGTKLEEYSRIAADNPYISYLVSLDGYGNQNDRIRGEGVYENVTEGIKRIKSLKKAPYIGIQFTIRAENISGLHAFCGEMIRLGVNWILLNPFWFITEEESRRYERFMEDRFSITPRTHRGLVLPYLPDRDEYLRQYGKVQAEDWPIQISSYFSRPEGINAYIDDPDSLVKEKRCFKQWIRLDVTPSGDVCPCIQFPDLKLGNLKERNLREIWNGSLYDAFRRTIRRENLPICAKCNNIYLYDIKRKHL